MWFQCGVGAVSRNLHFRRSTTPFGYLRSHMYPYIPNRLPVSKTVGQEELKKLRHREAQRRYYAKKKMEMQLRLAQARANKAQNQNLTRNST
ncbi:hypothetical protein BaRGS_00027560 [Batillaria attramentaria]|uniref:Uncharacterized protein n=1 Tax=Batillaria attramentaria TaxID=370345 RepID=A0ABD0K377_9CAEN